ncbi:MAG TPA: alanine/glycine:cation symporter family protein [Flavobacteriaceae bacterium]|nr:alanine/glycine:cation symporter family protein [Flavobacteriaceae bacterium]
MKKYLLGLLTLLTPFLTFAQDASDSGASLDAIFKKYTGWFVDFVFLEIHFSEEFQIPWVLIVLVGGAIYFTFYFKFINIRRFGTAIKVVSGKYEDIEKHGARKLYDVDDVEEQQEQIEEILDEGEGSDGEVSHFQALTAALSATVGLGNIAGVAVALSIGGPGATFWMIAAGIVGMATKFTECTLGVTYRDIDPDGTVYGGPMYYLKKGLGQKNMGKLGRILAILFAIFVVGGSIGGGNMFQSNQASAQFNELFHLQDTNASIWFGIIMAILVGIVIIGGIKRIAKVTEKVVPFMAGMYILAAVIILVLNYQYIGAAFALIFKGAFSGLGIAGGVVGVFIQGIRRGAFSNEAGIGSSAIAHSAVKTKYPASEGIVALLEPFIDTVVICTMTALVIIITNFDHNILVYGDAITEGVELTANAFDSVIPHFSIVLTIAVILFAFSTMISWSYYGMQGWAFLFGRSRRTEMTYKVIFCFFTFLGATISLGSVIDFSDAMIFAMAVPNIIGLVILAPVVKKELKKYMNAIKLKDEALDEGLEDIQKKM